MNTETAGALTIIDYTIRAYNGAPAVLWQFHRYYAGAGRYLVDALRNGHDFAYDMRLDEIEATLALDSRTFRHRRKIVRKIVEA